MGTSVGAGVGLEVAGAAISPSASLTERLGLVGAGRFTVAVASPAGAEGKGVGGAAVTPKSSSRRLSSGVRGAEFSCPPSKGGELRVRIDVESVSELELSLLNIPAANKPPDIKSAQVTTMNRRMARGAIAGPLILGAYGLTGSRIAGSEPMCRLSSQPLIFLVA